MCKARTAPPSKVYVFNLTQNELDPDVLPQGEKPIVLQPQKTDSLYMWMQRTTGLLYDTVFDMNLLDKVYIILEPDPGQIAGMIMLQRAFTGINIDPYIWIDGSTKGVYISVSEFTAEGTRWAHMWADKNRTKAAVEKGDLTALFCDKCHDWIGEAPPKGACCVCTTWDDVHDKASFPKHWTHDPAKAKEM